MMSMKSILFCLYIPGGRGALNQGPPPPSRCPNQQTPNPPGRAVAANNVVHYKQSASHVQFSRQHDIYQKITTQLFSYQPELLVFLPAD